VARRGAWRSLVSAPVWGTGGPEFESRRPDCFRPLSRLFPFGRSCRGAGARTVAVRGEGPKSASKRLEGIAADVADRLEELQKHSGVVRVAKPPPSPRMVDLRSDWTWTELDAAGRAAQHRARDEYTRFRDLASFLLKCSPEPGLIGAVIEQGEWTAYDDPAALFLRARAELEGQVARVRELYDPNPGEYVFVPDANAVVLNPALDEWDFGVGRFSVVLTSTLLGELDELKMPYRGVREKAESAIRRIKEYRRRGDIRVGVPLRSELSTVRMTAREPNFADTLPWLDPAVKDDRLLASVLELVRERPQSPVVLVTRDINLQNKADHAAVDFVEPPDPPVEETKPRRLQLPDIRILELRPTGGSAGQVHFSAWAQNYDSRPAHLTVRATVAGNPVRFVHPQVVNLLSNEAPTQLGIHASRPEQGELLHALNDATTLYGEELVLELLEGDDVVTQRAWREEVYDPVTDAARAETQARAWREARGEASEQDTDAVS
jgi:PIN domain